MTATTFSMLGWILIAGSLLLLTWGASLGWQQWQRTSAWRRANGVVVAEAVRALTPGNPYHFPIVEFVTDDGTARRFESDTGRYVHPVPVGTQVEVIYDPAQPDAARIDRFADRWFATSGIMGLGLIALFLGLMFVALAR